MEHSTSQDFPVDGTVRVDGQVSFFLSDRSLDNGISAGVYESDIIGLQVKPYSIRLMKC